MTRPVAILRPQPGHDATAARARALGLTVVSLPLFEIVALPWAAPDPSHFDALLLTSANAVRWGGAALADVLSLPVIAVGEATTSAARAAGFDVMVTGDGNASALVAMAAATGVKRALHIGGRETTIDIGGIISESIAVYASEQRPVSPRALEELRGGVALLHSARAARRLGALIDLAGFSRQHTAIAAFSPAVAQAAGPGWDAVVVAATPDDAALLAEVASLVGGHD